MRPSRRADDVCLSLRERVLWISGGAVARSGQDRTLGHAALVGCGFGMVLSALKMVRYLATRSKTRRTARANCRSTVSRQKGGVNRLRTLGPRSRPLAADDRLPHP